MWPEVSTRLGKLLTSRGASRDVADDVVQEVAARALANGISFDDATDLMRWAVPVALNLLVDSARHAGRVTVGIDGWDAAEGDVADLVAHRDRLTRVLGAVARLSDADRAALTEEGDAPNDRREAVKLAVRRHRARRRLLQLVDGVAGAVGAAAAFGMWVRRARPSRVAATAVPVAFALPVALVLVQPAPLPSDERRIEAAAAPSLSRPSGRGTGAGGAAPARRSGGATAVRPALRVVAPKPAVRKPAERPGREIVNVGPQGGEVKVVERPRTDDDKTLCVYVEVPVVGEPCVGDPRETEHTHL